MRDPQTQHLPQSPLDDPKVPPPPGVGPSIDGGNRRRTTSGDEAFDERRPRRPRLPLATTTALVIAIVVTACGLYLLLKPSNVNPRTGTARLMLSKSQVALGDTYSATASGFSPGENLRFVSDRPDGRSDQRRDGRLPR